MKIATKLLSGLFVASALTVGCLGASGNNVHAAGLTPQVTVLKTSTTSASKDSEKGVTKPLVFYNQTNQMIKKLEIKTNVGSEYITVFDEKDALKPSNQWTINEVTFSKKVKTMSFRFLDEKGQEHLVENSKVTDLETSKEIGFVFEQDSEGLFVVSQTAE